MTIGFEQNNRTVSTFILTLGALPGIGPAKLREILSASKAQIQKTDLLDEAFARSLNNGSIDKGLAKLAEADASWNSLEEAADTILERAFSEGIHVLNPYMDEYPRRLLFNDRFPTIFYCMGNASILNPEKAVAIIGTRNPTDFGERMGRRLSSLLAEDDYVVVSGLALGCDTIAHEGTLEVGGKTIAVLPTPINSPVYPKQNQRLAERIVENDGLLFSEYPPGVPLVDRQLVRNLVARDEWQPGLSDGVIAMETSVDGGTTHAIEHAKSTQTPFAVFDYSSRTEMRFTENERFGGNVKYLNEGACPIFAPETIDIFKTKMDEYRQIHSQGDSRSDSAEYGQLTLFPD